MKSKKTPTVKIVYEVDRKRGEESIFFNLGYETQRLTSYHKDSKGHDVSFNKYSRTISSYSWNRRVISIYWVRFSSLIKGKHMEIDRKVLEKILTFPGFIRYFKSCGIDTKNLDIRDVVLN